MTQRHIQKISMYTLASDSNETAVLPLPADSDNAAILEEGNLHRIVEQMPGILWTTDLDMNITFSLGNGLGRLNPLMHPFAGMPLSEFFGDESVHSQVLDAHYNALGGCAQSFEIIVGDTTFWGMVEPLFNAEWNLIGTVGMATEITHRKAAETEQTRRLEQTQEADKRQALVNLASGVTHHLGNLFTSIAGYAAIVGMGLPADHPGQRWLGEIEKASQCAGDLVDQLVCPGGSGIPRNEPVNLTHLITENSQVYQALLCKRMRLHFDLAQEEASVQGDPDQLRRLLVNLIYNASTAIGEGEGTISVRTQIIRGQPIALFDEEKDCGLPEGEYVWLQVSDTGRGLDGQSRTRVYEPFAGFSGRGMGLGAALGIVTGHRGSISISSKPGLGTTCHVFLPVMERAEAAPVAPEYFF